MKFYGPNDLQSYYDAPQSIVDYNNAFKQRVQARPAQNWNFPDITDDLRTKGYFVWRNAFDVNKLMELRVQAERHFHDGTSLKLRDRHFDFILNPMVACPAAFDIGFSELLLNVGTAFYQKCLPGHGTCNLRLSKVNDLPPESTSLWHFDRGNSIKFIKAFFPLTDMDESNAFTYVEGSHNHKFETYQSKYRWTDEEIFNIYPTNKIKYLTGKPGDVIFATTNGCHKGNKARKERILMTYNIVIHPEINGGRAVIRKEDYENLPDEKKAFADFCDKI